MFKKPIELMGWVILGLFCFWIAGVIFTNDKCTRVYRTGWPAWYGFELVEFVSQNWTDDSQKFALFKYQIKSTIALQSFSMKTIYGESIKCKI